ncbi:class I SAM-dependent DNA methyltransferase [Streptomyces spiramenti]|uniref:Class I SAM-dependent methyltransferase n=1 Tax=Streptomyces spiramenti TaxID=2720606 RepID=A0ABX1AR22_9ACTN|nr:class I SAM-dependent methyltransferase [Streptomyces spiramenti]NJP66747.1 class I SAM-dependent methyltransferase [Streptomyces spiramenti]
MYENEDAEIYDLIHEGRGKDYPGESELVEQQIRARRPDASSLLDVACGTGAHLQYFVKTFQHVEGTDISADMLEGAARRLPGVRFSEGDMSDFDLGRTFDAVTCLFASIGHLSSVEQLNSAVAAFGRHTNPGGVVVVDPWWFPDTFLPGHVVADVIKGEADGEEKTVVRMSHTSVEDGATRMNVHYLVADSPSGIRHFAKSARIMLFHREEYETAFTLAGLTPTFVPGGPAGRGLFVGVRD